VEARLCYWKKTENFDKEINVGRTKAKLKAIERTGVELSRVIDGSNFVSSFIERRVIMIQW
jgi:hypothetical protein